MSAPSRVSRDVIGVRVDDSQALLTNISDTVPRMQFMREIPFNAVQACQRALAAGSATGLVVVDYVDAPYAARKLRFWDNGDGMTRIDLFERLVSLSAQARTEHNFGVGAKLALAKVSPHGVIYVSLRDGQANLARMQRDDAGNWGMAELNPAGLTDLDRSVVPAPDGLLPAEILAAGHGTVVVLLGQSESDRTVWTLRPEGSSSKRWALEALNDRFTEFPDDVEVRVVMPDVEKAADGGMRDDTRTAHGSAGNLKYYTRDAKGSADPITGARGKVRIGGPVPATAYWWVLPVGATPPSYMRVGGKVRVVMDGEAYETHGARYMTTAGIWTQTTRVEIHFVPDTDTGIRPDLQRSCLKVDGAPVPLLEWCEEFKRSMPAAVKNLMAGSVRTRVSADFSAELGELYTRMVSVAGRRRGRRSQRGTHVGVAGGQVVAFAPSTEEHGATPDAPRRAKGLRRLLPARFERSATVEVVTGEVVHLDAAPGVGRKVRATPAPPPMPSFTWANEVDMSDDAELGALAARYVPGDNVLLLNCQGTTYQAFLGTWLHRYKDEPGSADWVKAQVRDYFALNLADAVIGAQRDYPDSWEAMVTPEALTVRAAGVYHIDTRLRQIFGRKFKGAGPCDAVGEQDIDAAA